ISVCVFFSSRRRHTRFSRDWSSDVCSSDLLRSGRAASRCFNPGVQRFSPWCVTLRGFGGAVRLGQNDSREPGRAEGEVTVPQTGRVAGIRNEPTLAPIGPEEGSAFQADRRVCANTPCTGRFLCYLDSWKGDQAWGT